MVMTTADTSAASEDPWEQSSTQTVNVAQRPAARSTSVPDDWDADDDEDNDDDEPDAKMLWEIANSRPPMPQIQPSTTSTSASTVPPPAAFEAPLRILKRPSPANSQSASPLNGAQVQKTFKEREAQYQAARERIFGEDSRETGRDRDVKPTLNPATAGSSIIRDPIGPIFAPADGDAKGGFKARQKSGNKPQAAPHQAAVVETMVERDPPTTR